MKPTPRTDKALCECERLPLSVSVIDLHKMANLARELERELEELQKDKARLDWIEENLCEMEYPHDTLHSRESIDRAMQSSQAKPQSIESAMGMPEVGANVDQLGIGKGSRSVAQLKTLTFLVASAFCLMCLLEIILTR